MLSTKNKIALAEAIQAMLQTIKDDELPEGEINFILHIDGKEGWSWANIRNSSHRELPVPSVLIQNLTNKSTK